MRYTKEKSPVEMDAGRIVTVGHIFRPLAPNFLQTGPDTLDTLGVVVMASSPDTLDNCSVTLRPVSETVNAGRFVTGFCLGYKEKAGVRLIAY